MDIIAGGHIMADNFTLINSIQKLFSENSIPLSFDDSKSVVEYAKLPSDSTPEAA